MVYFYIIKKGSNMLTYKNVKGSITVEASLVFPIFIFAVTAFLYFFQIMLVQENIQHAITETGKYASEVAFIYERVSKSPEKPYDGVVQIMDGVLMKVKMKEFLEENIIDNSCIIGGMNGVIMSFSSFLEENDTIDIIAVYQFKIPIPIISIKRIPMVQRVKVRAFTGYKPVDSQGNENEGSGEGEDRIVYITQTGTVYHYTKECSHIKLDIRQLKYLLVEQERNNSGGKYYPCEQCIGKLSISNEEVVYITTFGNRYHNQLSCSGLKRTIIEIPLSKTEGKAPCSRCSGR